MSNQNPGTEGVELEETAKDPVFTGEVKAEKVVPEEAHTDKFHEMTGKAQKRLNKIEDQFVSLNSQRQINFVLGGLLILAALTAGGLGIIICFLLGALMIVQAATGNMIINEFFDHMDQKHKRWLIPGFIGVVIFILIAYIMAGLLISNDDGNSRTNYSQRR